MPPPPEPPTALELEHQTLLTAPAPRLPACDALSPRFPTLAYFVRLLAVLAPCEAARAEELLTVYTMGWHAPPDDEDGVPDSPDAFARFVADELPEDTADRVIALSHRFAMFYRRCPLLQARFKRLSCCPHAVVLPV